MFSDPISHTLSFASKQLAQGPPRTAADLARPATIGVLLARYDCEEAVIQAGVLSEVLSQVSPAERGEVERRIAQKFGRAVHGIAVDALGPDLGPARKSLSRPWESAPCGEIGRASCRE